jgi:AraC-like DNA-binding protein
MHIPPAPLDKYIEAIWLIEGYVLPHAFERVLPNGDMSIVINLAEDSTRAYASNDLTRCERLSGAIVCGPRARCAIVDTAELWDTMGVHFKPGGAFPFFNLPAEELQNAHVGLNELWGTQGRCLRERLLEALSPEAKFRVMENALLRRIAQPRDGHRAVRYALSRFRRSPHDSISSVIEEVGLSQRRFIRVFAHEVGLTPKLYCRVHRFQKAIAKTFVQRRFDWAELALECGYFDQAHFVHDFTEFSGLTPTSYMAQRALPGNHVPLPE